MAIRLLVAVSMAGCAYDFGLAPESGTGGAAVDGATIATGITAADQSAAVTAASASGATAVASSSTGVVALPRDCAEILATSPESADGRYLIDPDEAGGDDPFEATCDMTTEGGGWTRFNWMLGEFPQGADPLGERLAGCDPEAVVCRGRIPEAISPTELLVRDIDDDAYAVWAFDGSNVATAALGALRNKSESCLTDEDTWNPEIETSDEYFCSDAAGGCNSFKYGPGGCNGGDAWIVELDDDSHWCAAAFKLGRATGIGNCGAVDWGYLDDCGCRSEHGALWFR